MAVAVTVLSGAADAGLGICAAAKALNLEFIPVVTEQYDLVIPLKYFKTVPIQTLLEIINNQKFVIPNALNTDDLEKLLLKYGIGN